MKRFVLEHACVAKFSLVGIRSNWCECVQESSGAFSGTSHPNSLSHLSHGGRCGSSESMAESAAKAAAAFHACDAEDAATLSHGEAHSCNGSPRQYMKEWDGECSFSQIEAPSAVGLLGESGVIVATVQSALQDIRDVHCSDKLMHFENDGACPELTIVRCSRHDTTCSWELKPV